MGSRILSQLSHGALAFSRLRQLYIVAYEDSLISCQLETLSLMPMLKNMHLTAGTERGLASLAARVEALTRSTHFGLMVGDAKAGHLSMVGSVGNAD
jgi:hypothetical protein